MEDVPDVAYMLQQIGKPPLQRFQVLLIQFAQGNAAAMLQRPDAGYDNDRIGSKSGHTAFDIQEFFRPQIGAEARLCHTVISQLQCHAGGGYRIAAVGNIGKGPSVDDGRRMLQGLDQVGLQGIFQQRAHGALRVKISGSHRFLLRGLSIGVAHHQSGQPGLEIIDIIGQTENSHDLGSGGDVVAVLPGRSVAFSAQAVHHAAQLPVIHVHTSPPGDPAGIDIQFVALVNMVVNQSGKKIVGGADSMKVTGKVEIDILHGNYLGIASAGGAALDAENGAQRGFAQGGNYLFAGPLQGVCQADGGGFSFTGRRRIDSRYQYELSVRGIVFRQQAVVDLRLIFSVLFQVAVIDAGFLGNPGNRLHGTCLGNFNV